jgi:predicted nuclease with TOPRIM domain
MSTEYTPPPRLIWENVNNALDMVVGRCRELREEIKQLKEKHKLLEDILNSQAEVDKRTRVERQNLRMSLHRRTDQVEQLKKEVAKLTSELNNPRYFYDCPF